MKTQISTIEGLHVDNKVVLLRVDFNVPFDKNTGEISDTTRIERSLPTIQYLLNDGAALVIMSHLGRPKGKDKSLSLEPVAKKLAELLNQEIDFSGSIDKESIKKARQLKAGDILVLENLRYYKEETSKEVADRKGFAELLASHADLYVDDAFGACHREHASIFDIAKLLPSYAGLLLKKEIDILETIFSKAEKPFVAIIGGAKVSSKIGVLDKLVKKVDSVLIGGGMAYTFLKARAIEVGNSLTEPDYYSKAFQIVDKADYHHCQLLLPEDHIASSEFSEKAKKKTVGREIPNGFMGLDIGPKTIDKYIKVIKNAKTVLWNGPVGVFEMKPFSKGTMKIAKALTKVKGTTIIGGGDSIAAVNQAGVANKITHISTGGGAKLEFLEGRKLPGIEALKSD